MAVVHDLNLVAPFADPVAVLDGGRLVASGPPATALARPIVRAVFALGRSLATNPGTSREILGFETPQPDSPFPTSRTHHASQFFPPRRRGRFGFIGLALAYPVTIDDCGAKLTFDKAPTHAVVHDVDMSEMAFALHLQSDMAGVTGISGWYKVTPAFKAAQEIVSELAPKYPTLETLLAADAD